MIDALNISSIRTSWSILRNHPKLWIFPILGIAISVILYACLCVWYFVEPVLNPTSYINYLTSLDHVIEGIITYLLIYFVMSFFNAALANSYLTFLENRHLSIREGFIHPWNQLPKVFLWSLFSGTVGRIFAVLSGRALGPGEILSAILGGAWKSLACFMLILASRRPAPLWKNFLLNKELIQKTWGSWVIPRIGVERLAWLICFMSAIPWLVGVLINHLSLAIGFAITLFLWLLSLSFLSVFASLLEAARYHYVETGKLAQGWNKDDIVDAFVPHQRDW